MKFLVCNVPNHRSWFNTADIQTGKAVLASVGFVPAPETAGVAVAERSTIMVYLGLPQLLS